MKTDTIIATEEAAEGTLFLGDDWFDPLEAGVRTRIRSFIEELLEAELDVALGRDRYERPRLAETGVGGRPVVGAGHRHGHRQRGLMGTRLILDGTVVRVRLDRKATSISLLVALGVRQDGQKILLAVKNMGGESEAAWRTLLDDLVKRGLKTPELAIVDGAPGLEKALAALWSDIPVQRCTVHKHRNLLAHAPDRLHDELSADYKDMIYVGTKQEIETKRKAFIRKWRLKCKAVADSLEEAGDKLFTFTRFPKSQWKSIRTSNAIERLHEEFKRRIKTQTVLPAASAASG
jgi:transposase-like protein